jgi:hypothetical protein
MNSMRSGAPDDRVSVKQDNPIANYFTHCSDKTSCDVQMNLYEQ